MTRTMKDTTRTPTDTAVAEAVAAINEIHDRVVRTGIDGLVKIGRIVLDMAYEGDANLYRSKDPTKAVGLRKVAEHPDIRLPGDAKHRVQALARAVGMYLTFTALPEPVRPALSVAHVEALLPVKDGALRDRLAERAVKERFTDREFRKAVRRAREQAGERVRRTVRTPGHSPAAQPGKSAPVPVPVAEDWTATATRLLEDHAGRKALDAVLEDRGLRITLITSNPKPKKSKTRPNEVDTSNWSIRQSDVPGARVTIATADLREALRVIPYDTAPNYISGHVVFRVLDGRLEGLSYSGRLYSAIPLRADGEVGTSWTMEAPRLKQLIKSVKDETVIFGHDDHGVAFLETADTTLTFQSLNPSTFPFRDKDTAEAKPTAKVPAKRLAAALAYLKPFISDEGEKPDLCVAEVKDGILQATNQRAATLVKVPGLENSALQVHGKDAGALCALLGSCKDGEVEVLEHARALFVRREDGAVFAESRFGVAFPGLKVNMDEKDQRVWTLPKEPIQKAMAQLHAVAVLARDGKRVVKDHCLRFVLDADGRSVQLSMTSATGDIVAVDVPLLDTAEVADAPPLPAAGFTLDRESLRKALAWWPGDALCIGLNVVGTRGFSRLVFEDEGNKYLTIIAWLREPKPEPSRETRPDPEPHAEPADDDRTTDQQFSEPTPGKAVGEAQHAGLTGEPDTGPVVEDAAQRLVAGGDADPVVAESAAPEADTGRLDAPAVPVTDTQPVNEDRGDDDAEPELVPWPRPEPEPEPERAPDTPWSRNGEGAWERQVDGLHVVVVPGQGAEVLVKSGVPLGYRRTQYAFGTMITRYVRDLLRLPDNMRLDYRSHREGRGRVHRVFPVAPSKAAAYQAAVTAAFGESR